jgi:hypothetical protein
MFDRPTARRIADSRHGAVDAHDSRTALFTFVGQCMQQAKQRIRADGSTGSARQRAPPSPRAWCAPIRLLAVGIASPRRAVGWRRMEQLADRSRAERRSRSLYPDAGFVDVDGHTRGKRHGLGPKLSTIVRRFSQTAIPLDGETPGHWRRRWLQFAEVPLEEVRVAKRLADAPKPGAPSKFTPEQICQIIALACEKPSESGRPVSQWSHGQFPLRPRAVA